MYKSIKESPKDITISTYWNPGGQVSYLREGLPYDHEENLYNWFVREYPDLNSAFYNITKSERVISAKK
jgi:hypothetical protein